MSDGSNKIIVVYKSKYGSTKRYAEWIAEATNGDLVASSKIRIDELLPYQTIVFGGSLHATGIKGVELIVKNFEQLRTKKVIIFAVGCSPAREEAIQHVKDVNFTDECKVKVKFFYFRGAFDYHKLSFIDKMMMYMLKIKLKIKKEEELDEDSRGLLACYHQPVDWTNKGDIQAIAQCIKEE